jgi:hypothetical protein
MISDATCFTSVLLTVKVFAFGLSAKMTPKASELLFPHDNQQMSRWHAVTLSSCHAVKLSRCMSRCRTKNTENPKNAKIVDFLNKQICLQL